MRTKLSDIQERVREHPKWGYLATMFGETEIEQPTAGVNFQGLLLVNPELAGELSSSALVKRVREEFKVARELRDGVQGFN